MNCIGLDWTSDERQSVDILLAFCLMVGSVAGAQFGASAGQHLKGDQLRALLAIIVLGVAFRFALTLFIAPADPFSVDHRIWREPVSAIRTLKILLASLLVVCASGMVARAQGVVFANSDPLVTIHSTFTGQTMTLFGNVEPSAARRHPNVHGRCAS